MRQHNRSSNALRPIRIIRNYTNYAEGSVLIELGETRVLCTASVTAGVPLFLKDTGQGWVTAEYGMLPRATHSRVPREAAKGKQSGRTQEIQRLIGRSLRAAVDLKTLGENTIVIDCDVIQADGGTRTASITGACVALFDAIQFLKNNGLETNPFKYFVAAVSVGIYSGSPLLDLNYEEDSNAETDMNVVMNENEGIIEIQGTAERNVFTQQQLSELINLATLGINNLVQSQKQACLKAN